MPVMPDIGGLTYDPFLTNISTGAFQTDEQFAVHRAFPILRVGSPSGKITGWSRADLLRDEMRRRLPGAHYGRVGAGTEVLSYTVEEFGLEWPVDHLVRAKAMAPFQLDRVAAEGLAQKAMIHLERAWISTFFTTGVWTGSSTSTDLVGGTDFTAWNDLTATPIELIKTQKRAVVQRTGVVPNTLILSQAAWDALTESPDIMDRLGNATTRQVNRANVAGLMELDKIVVSSGIYNTAQEGEALNASFVMGNHAWLGYSAPAPAENQISAGYTVVWAGWVPGANIISPVSSYEEIQTRSTIHRIDLAYALLKTAADAGVFFQNVIA